MDTREKILQFIQQYFKTQRVPPTLREIMDGTGAKSTSVVTYHLERLEHDGRVEWRRNQARGVIPL